MPGWKFMIGGGEKIKNMAPQNNGQMQHPQTMTGGTTGGMGRGVQNNGGGQMNQGGGHMGGMNGPNTNTAQHVMPFAPPLAQQYPHMGGGHTMAMNNFAMGYYDGSRADMTGGPHMTSGYAARNAQMGYIHDEPENNGGGDGYEPEMRRGRSRRTGRFVHRAEGGGQSMQARAGGWDDDEDEQERGSYGRSESEGGGEEVKKLKKQIKKMEQRLEEAEESQEMVKKLRKKVKQLEEALEEAGGESGGKGGKKKKKSGKNEDDEEDDDEDDPVAGLLAKLKEGGVGEELLKCFPRLFRETAQVIADPPKTWPPYLEKGDMSGIYTMEAKELIRAIDGYKAGQKGVDAVMQEIQHTGAALVQLYMHLIRQLEEKK